MPESIGNRFDPRQESSNETTATNVSPIASRAVTLWEAEALPQYLLPSFRGAQLHAQDRRSTAAAAERTETFSRPIGDDPVPALSSLPSLESRVRPREHFIVLQKWEGTVLSIADGEFTALTRDLTDPAQEDEEVALALEEVAPSDFELVQIGAVFYWAIGYKETLSGGRERVSELRFRRFPVWTSSDLREVELKARRLAKYFG